jgi:hypothetical protein
LGNMLEIRVYQYEELTLAQLDDQIDWDCSPSTNYQLCDMCPYWVGLANTCLEDLTYTGRSTATKALLKA